MLEEFATSLVGSRIVAWPSLERLSSPSALPQLQDEAPAVAAHQLEDEDPTAVSCELRTPPPRPIQWVVDSSKTHTEHSYPLGFGPVDLTVDAGPPSSPPVDTHKTVDNDDFAKRCLDSFINKVMRKRDYSLIREPPKQPPAKPVLPWRSRRLAAQSLSRVPTSKRGEVLIMQCMGYTKGPSAPSASDLEAFDKLFDGNLSASNAEAMDALFPAVRKGSSRQPRRHKAIC
jgi:hypothetical protein